MDCADSYEIATAFGLAMTDDVLLKSSMISGAIFLVIISFWLIGFWKINDFGVKSKTADFENVLVIYPHPDDESLSTGGLLTMLTKRGKKTNLLVLTKGEAGENYFRKGDLKEIRSEELRKSAEILGVSNLITADFGDGKIKANYKEVEKFIDEQIDIIKPDLIITYDLSGLYGHEDHITASEIVTNLVKNKYKNIKLWYNTLPQKVMAMADLPVHMAKDQDFLMKRTAPNIKVFIGLNVIEKVRSLYSHRSQYGSFRNSKFKFLPMWFMYSMFVYEYFYEAN